MIEKIRCLASFRLDRLQKYLSVHGFYSLPRISYPRPFLTVFVRNKNKNKLWKLINNFEQIDN